MKRNEATDSQLLSLYEEGRDQSAFAEIVRRHSRMVMATARRVSTNPEDSEEAVQATFFALAKAIDKLRNKAAVAGWLHRAANTCASQIQRANAQWARNTEQMMNDPNSSPNDEHGANEPSTCVANKEIEQILHEELARLPDILQAALVLCDMEGLSQKKAAKELGIPPSTVNDHVVKGRRLLRDRLVRRGIAVPAIGLTAYLASSVNTVSALSETAAADLVSKATLYAAGNSAAQIGVPETTIHTANMVVATMTKAKLLSVFLIAIALLAFSGSLAGLVGVQLNTAKAGTLFFDDFSDGNYADGLPVTWYPFAPEAGGLDASSGELIITRDENLPPDFDIVADAKDIVLSDMSVRAVAMPTETNGGVFVLARTQDPEETLGYFGGVGYSPEFGGSYAIAGVSLTQNTQDFFMSSDGRAVVNLPYDVRNEFSEFQIDVFGDEIKVWAWLAGTDMPVEPLFVATDSTYTEPGHVRIAAVRADRGLAKGGSAIIRSVHMAAIPIHEIPPVSNGDFDRNGILDAADIDRLNKQIQLGIDHATFDLNDDGVVSEADRNVWVQDIAGTFLGDANLDSSVDAADLNALALNWQQSVASWAGGDFTGDGLVNAADLNVLALNWQNSVNSPASVPEPSSLLLLSILFGSSIFLGRGVANNNARHFLHLSA